MAPQLFIMRHTPHTYQSHPSNPCLRRFVVAECWEWFGRLLQAKADPSIRDNVSDLQSFVLICGIDLWCAIGGRHGTRLGTETRVHRYLRTTGATEFCVGRGEQQPSGNGRAHILIEFLNRVWFAVWSQSSSAIHRPSCAQLAFRCSSSSGRRASTTRHTHS